MFDAQLTKLTLLAEEPDAESAEGARNMDTVPGALIFCTVVLGFTERECSLSSFANLRRLGSLESTPVGVSSTAVPLTVNARPRTRPLSLLSDEAFNVSDGPIVEAATQLSVASIVPTVQCVIM